MQQFTLTDGAAGMVIGGVTNLSVPGDQNVVSGTISVALGFQDTDFLQLTIGSYLYEVSSPMNSFAPVSRSFLVTAAAFPQWITGNVVSNIPAVSTVSGPRTDRACRGFAVF